MNEQVLGRKARKMVLRDGNTYIVAPLPIDDLIEVWPIIEKLEEAKEAVSLELIEGIKKLAYVVLKANNENIDETKVGKIVDLLDMQEIIPIIVGQKTNPSTEDDKGQI